MSLYVLDTSVAVAWYLPETFSEAARSWQERLLANTIRMLVPPLHYLEFANVLRSYVRRGELERRLAQDIDDLHRQAPLERAESDDATLLATALDYDATVYDAAYIQLVRAYKAPLLTAERTTRPWVVKLGKLARPIGKN